MVRGEMCSMTASRRLSTCNPQKQTSAQPSARSQAGTGAPSPSSYKTTSVKAQHMTPTQAPASTHTFWYTKARAMTGREWGTSPQLALARSLQSTPGSSRATRAYRCRQWCDALWIWCLIIHDSMLAGIRRARARGAQRPSLLLSPGSNHACVLLRKGPNRSDGTL